MTTPRRGQTQGLRVDLFLTIPQDCGYLPGQRSTSLMVDPALVLDARGYGVLLGRGFRRSGETVYRPYCPVCTLCMPMRLPVEKFSMSRNMRRVWLDNQDILVRAVPPCFQEEHFVLYQQYLRERHGGSPMDNPEPADYLEFLSSGWSDTRFYEFRLDGRLIQVAVVDHVQEALSSVYTFYDPTLSKRSLGTFAILWTIHLAQRLRKNWVYLGYWIAQCRKMRYKSRFAPLELYQEGEWRFYEQSPGGGGIE